MFSCSRTASTLTFFPFIETTQSTKRGRRHTMSESSAPRSPAGRTRVVSAQGDQTKGADKQPSHLMVRDGEGNLHLPVNTASRPEWSKKEKKPKQPPPPWVFAGKPVRRGPRRMLWYLYLWFKLYKFKAIPQPRPHGVYIVAIWRKRNEIRLGRLLQNQYPFYRRI